MSYILRGADGRPYESGVRGRWGGHSGSKIYGRLDCPSALRALARGGYARHRVFFADEDTAVAAGYRPCAVCCKDRYDAWKAGRAASPSTGNPPGTLGPPTADRLSWRRVTVDRAGAGMTAAAEPGYPEHLLAREAAPPYPGEGPFALWHFSEEPSLARFEPRAVLTDPDGPRLVWAVDTRHAPMFWFPRDCPRGCVWPVSTTTPEDRERFFGQSGGARLHVIESAWLERMRACRLYGYRLPADGFSPHDTVGGYWTAEEPVEAAEQVTFDDLLGQHARAGIELRVSPSIWPFWRRVVASTVAFSGSRLRNAAGHPERVA